MVAARFYRPTRLIATRPLPGELTLVPRPGPLAPKVVLVEANLGLPVIWQWLKRWMLRSVLICWHAPSDATIGGLAADRGSMLKACSTPVHM